MRYLVISDIHSNWEALEAVIEDARGKYDRAVCCGDLAGYGPDPNLVIDWARMNLDAVIRGNHDRACAGIDDLENFNPVARAANLWTIASLTAENSAYLRALPAGPLTVDGFQLVHGSPLDEDEYLMSFEDVRNVIPYLEAGITFFGHTHLQGLFGLAAGQYQTMGRPDPWEHRTTLPLNRRGAYLINPGSVGQPRDRDPRAAYAFFDSETWELTQRRVRYDHEVTRRKIEAAGLPDVLGARLEVGR
jgi:predicted phosphodiesterase